jgi:two-component system response regulator RegA
LRADPEGVRLLLVEDDEPYRRRLCRAFRDRRFVVAEAASAVEGLEVARSFRPQRAVLDLRLEEGSGIELLAELRRELPDVACVVLTGYGSIATAVEAMRQGAIHYLTKPADADEILLAFENASTEAAEPAEPAAEVPSLHRVEWEHIQRILNACGGNVSRAARLLGLHRRTLQRKLAVRPPQR